MKEKHLVVGIDIGGKHITASFIDTGSMIIQAGSTNTGVVKAKASVGVIIDSWKQVKLQTTKNILLQDIKIGIAMPVPFNYEAAGISLMKDNRPLR